MGLYWDCFDRGSDHEQLIWQCLIFMSHSASEYSQPPGMPLCKSSESSCGPPDKTEVQPYLYMWLSRGISGKLHMWHFQFSIWLKSPLGEVHFAENPTWIGPVVPRLWAIEGVITIENNSYSVLFPAISQDRHCRLPTDLARSQHICFLLVFEWLNDLNDQSHIKSANYESYST